MTTNRTLKIVRTPGRDAYQIQLIEYVDNQPYKGSVLAGDIETRILTDDGWALLGEFPHDLPPNVPTISGLDLSGLPKKKRRRFSKFVRLLAWN